MIPLVLAASVAAEAMAAPQAQPSPSDQTRIVVARANGRSVGDGLIKLVARKFRPTSLAGASLERATGETPQQALARLCGTYTPALYEELSALNGERTPPLGKPMREAASRLWFPACLRVITVEAWRRPTPPDARARRTPFETLVQSLPKNSFKTVTSSVLATPVELTPIDGVDVNKVAAEIRRRGGAAKDAPPMVGRIVERVGAVPADVDPAAAAACPANSPAFDATLVRSAFEYSVRRRPATAGAGLAQVVVVDNGFFGVDPAANSPFTAAFPERLFGAWARQGSLVGPLTYFGPKVYSPVVYYNDWTASAVDEVAGHGTHVAGLAVGGPAYLSGRDSLLLGGSGAIGLAIVNIGNGGRELLENSQTLITGLLKTSPPGAPAVTANIVNMSISYEGEQANGIFWSLFDDNRGSLFVVAAGNSREDVVAQSTYPAAWGNKENVLTVAAHDAGSTPALAWFTNYGSAVDLAAPGCGIGSWLTSAAQEPLTGTSQAAPLASFAAASLGALDSSLTAGELKNRMIATGRPLAGATRWRVRSGSYLDIPSALLIYDEVLTVRFPDPSRPESFVEETWIGDVTDVWGIRCAADTDPRTAFGRSRENLWSLKRSDEGLWLEHDRNVRQIARCVTAASAPSGSDREPDVVFRRRARVVGSLVVSDSPDLAAGAPLTVKLSTISRLAFRAR